MALRRGIAALVLAVVGLPVLLFVAGIVLLYVFATRGPTVPDRAALVVRPGGELLEVRPDDIVGQIVGRDDTTLRSIVESLRKARRDPRIAAVVLRPSTLELPFWGKVQELRDAITDFRRSRKPVIAYLEYGGDREYYLASAADQVYLLPSSPLDLTRHRVVRGLPARRARQDRRVSGLRADWPVQDGGEPAHAA